MVSYRCGRCRRRVSADAVDDHARNAHFVDPGEIDFSPIPEDTLVADVGASGGGRDE